MAKKPWTVGTCVQINRWCGYKLENYEDALLIPEAYIRQLDIHRELGQRFMLYTAAEHERGGWFDEDGDRNYDRTMMSGARIDYLMGHISVTGFVEDENEDPQTFGHTGIFRPQMWAEYPMSFYRKRVKEKKDAGLL